MNHRYRITADRLAACGAFLMLSGTAPAADGSWITGVPRAALLTNAPFEACRVPFETAAPFVYRYRPCWE
ncbi:hypothetical protein GCM10022280_25020 [Sphingomonas swuensis]|uniref:Uncharacterized protein n=1 Tax=Sphingomonas swuensis TaxID=977800 RepID=A0ABP7TA83_9SPHN